MGSATAAQSELLAYVVQGSGVQMKWFGSPPWVYLPLQGHGQSLSLQNIICTAIHPVYCGTPPWVPRTGTLRGHAAPELREGSKKQPSQKA